MKVKEEAVIKSSTLIKKLEQQTEQFNEKIEKEKSEKGGESKIREDMKPTMINGVVVGYEDKIFEYKNVRRRVSIFGNFRRPIHLSFNSFVFE